MFRIPRRAAWTTWDPNSKLYLELRGRARVIITYIAASGIVNSLPGDFLTGSRIGKIPRPDLDGIRSADAHRVLLTSSERGALVT